MLLPVLSRRCLLLRGLRGLRASADSAAGRGASVSGCGGGGHPALSWRSFSVLKRAYPQWCVHGLSSRCLFFSGPLSIRPSSSRPFSSGPSSPGELIYKGSLSNAIRGVKVFCYSTSGLSLVLMPQILLNASPDGGSLAFLLTFCGVISFFTFVSPLMLHFVTKGYVVRLYHEPQQDTYTAITYSLLLLEKRTVFHQSKVQVPEISKIFTTFYADGVGYLVNPERFDIPQDYNHLMGYDKPFTFSPDQLED